MSREEPHLHVVGPEEWIRRRRPGAAVLLVLLYAALFGGALWYLAARTGIWKKAPRKAPDAAAASVAAPIAKVRHGDAATRGGENTPTRDALLAGEGISEPARSRYFSRLATERCDCGCGRTLTDCLVNEKTCSRSPVLAGKELRQSAR